MSIEVVSWSAAWTRDFELVAADLGEALAGIAGTRVEHVGSTSVPGLAAKPILDIDVIVERVDVPAAVAALVRIGYVHRGDLGVAGRGGVPRTRPVASPARLRVYRRHDERPQPPRRTGRVARA